MSLGVSVMVTGALILRQVPVLLLGITITAASLALLGNHDDDYVRLMAEPAWRNTAMLIEETGAFTRAVYYPSSLTEVGEPLALIQVGELKLSRVPARLSIVKGDSAALILHNIGGGVIKYCRDNGVVFNDVESAIRDCLIKRVGIAKSIGLDSRGSELHVWVKGGLRLRHYDSTILRNLLGSPAVSSVAALVAEVTNRPVRLIEFEDKNGVEWGVLRVMEG